MTHSSQKELVHVESSPVHFKNKNAIISRNDNTATNKSIDYLSQLRHKKMNTSFEEYSNNLQQRKYSQIKKDIE